MSESIDSSDNITPNYCNIDNAMIDTQLNNTTYISSSESSSTTGNANRTVSHNVTNQVRSDTNTDKQKSLVHTRTPAVMAVDSLHSTTEENALCFNA